MLMQRYLIIGFLFALFGLQPLSAQPLEEVLDDYRFEKRIKGPTHKRGQLLEVKVDQHNNYLAMTFAATSYRYIHLYIYRLYTWEPVQELRVKAKRIELYNSVFDVDGKFFYANTDVYKNEYKKIDLKTGEISEVPCQEVPGNGCRPLEVRQYETTAYTVGENYVIFQDEKFENYVRIFVRKELYKIQNEEDDVPDFLKEPEEKETDTGPKVDPTIFTIWLDDKNLSDLKEYGYLKVSEFDILINNSLAKTFEFEKHSTSTIVLPEKALDSLQNQGAWIIENLRVAVKE